MKRETQIDLRQRDRLEEAQERLQQSRQIRSAGYHKLGVARSVLALGESAQAKGSLVEACHRYRQSLGILEPPRAPHVATVRRNVQELVEEGESQVRDRAK